MLKGIIIFIIFLIILNLVFILLRQIKKIFNKEDIDFYKSQFILNNKYYYDIKSSKFEIIIKKLEFAIELNMKYSSIVDLELQIKNDKSINDIRNINNSLSILKRLKEYNKNKFFDILVEYFGNNEYIKKIIVREIENAK